MSFLLVLFVGCVYSTGIFLRFAAFEQYFSGGLLTHLDGYLHDVFSEESERLLCSGASGERPSLALEMVVLLKRSREVFFLLI